PERRRAGSQPDVSDSHHGIDCRIVAQGGSGMRPTLVTAVVLGTILAASVWAQPLRVPAQGRPHADFQGYWMGVDPLDGGDSRRSLVRRSDDTYALAARGSVLTLFGGTRRRLCS